MSDDIKNEIKIAFKEVLHESVGQFYIERERHYQDHQFIKDFREFLQGVRGTATKTVVGLIITGVIGLIVLGFIVWSKKQFIPVNSKYEIQEHDLK